MKYRITITKIDENHQDLCDYHTMEVNSKKQARVEFLKDHIHINCWGTQIDVYEKSTDKLVVTAIKKAYSNKAWRVIEGKF